MTPHKGPGSGAGIGKPASFKPGFSSNHFSALAALHPSPFTSACRPAAPTLSAVVLLLAVSAVVVLLAANLALVRLRQSGSLAVGRERGDVEQR